MTSIIRRGAQPARTISKREFLTPFDEIFNSMLGDMFPRLHEELGSDFFLQGSYPKCNVVNFDDHIEIDAAIPGLTKDDVDIEIADGILTIKAESNQREDIQDSQYMKREIKRSAFARSFKLSENLDETGIMATHSNGILLITIPKIKETETRPKIRKIEIA